MPWEGDLSFSLPHHPRGRLSAGHGLPAASRGSFPQHIVRSCPQSPVRQKQVLCPGKESSAEDLRNVSGESGTGVHVLGEGLPSSAPGILDETSQCGGSHACRKNIKNVLLAKCLPLPVSEFSDTGNSRVCSQVLAFGFCFLVGARSKVEFIGARDSTGFSWRVASVALG